MTTKKDQWICFHKFGGQVKKYGNFSHKQELEKMIIHKNISNGSMFITHYIIFTIDEQLRLIF